MAQRVQATGRGCTCFPGARLKEEDLQQYVMDCLSQFPTIIVSHKECLESCATFEEMIAFLGRHSKSTLLAQKPNHTSAATGRASFQKGGSVRVMTAVGPLEPMLRAPVSTHIDDWEFVGNVKKGSGPRLFKFKFKSEEGQKAVEQLGAICYNCRSPDHFLSNCDKPYRNACGMLTEEFGKGTPLELEDRWQKLLQKMKERQAKRSSKSN